MDPHERLQAKVTQFSPEDCSTMKNGNLTKGYKMDVIRKEADIRRINPESFDPFSERKVNNPTTDFDTLAHLLKAVFGTGILAMPCAFRSSGLLVGVIAAIMVGLVSTHCAYILVKCAHILYHKTGKTVMSFPDVAEAAITFGPQSLRKFSKFARYGTQITLFVAYFGTCSVFAVVAAENFRNAIDQHMETIFPGGISERGSIACVLLPLVLLVLIPDLKYLAPVSMIANGFMIVSLAIIFWWIYDSSSSDLYFQSENFKMTMPIEKLPKFFSITIFAMEAIGVVMPIENEMKTPQNFIGNGGVLNKGMFGITLIYIILGVLGYMHDPNSTAPLITLEMPPEKIPSQMVRILVGLAVICTLRLLFDVCLNIVWGWIKNRCTKRPMIANYLLRAILMIGCVLLAVAVPKIGPFMGLIGASCFSIQGFLIPIFIETMTYWDVGFGFCNWMAIKNFIITIVALLALAFGSDDAIKDIIHLYSGTNETNIS